MSYYGGTITVAGRNLITSLLAGETIEFTRIVVGSGKMPEGVEPIDMTDLVNPVAEAVSTIPTVENGVMSMVVEYRNDLNGGLKEGFWLSEFGVYAKTEKLPECLLYFATLGDSPQPVNAYVDNRIDIRRYPITIALELDADVQVSYNPGAFITAEEAQQLLAAMVSEAVGNAGAVIIRDITIPAEDWTWLNDDDQGEIGEFYDEYRMTVDVVCEDATAEHFPSVALDKASLEVAKAARLCPTIQALDGVLRFWAKQEPEAEMTGTVALMTAKNGGSSGGGSATYVLPVATSTTLGGVKVQAGSGLNIDGQGNLSIDAASGQQAEDLFDSSSEQTE